MDNNANNARRMYFIYVVNAKKGHLKGADKSTFCFCRQLGLICYLKDPDPEPDPDPERNWNGTAFQNVARNGTGTEPQKKKCGSTTLQRGIAKNSTCIGARNFIPHPRRLT